MKSETFCVLAHPIHCLADVTHMFSHSNVYFICRSELFIAELSVGLFSSTQPNPTHQINDPTQPIARWTYRPMTRSNPYPLDTSGQRRRSWVGGGPVTLKICRKGQSMLYPLKCHIVSFKTVVGQLCKFHITKEERLVSKWKVKTNFSRRLKTVWCLDLTDHDLSPPYFTTYLCYCVCVGGGGGVTW